MGDKDQQPEVSALVHIPDSIYLDEPTELQDQATVATDEQPEVVVELSNAKLESSQPVQGMAQRQFNAGGEMAFSERSALNQLNVDVPYPVATRNGIMALLTSALAIGILYAVCFQGMDILPQLSFTIFCPIAFFVLAKILSMFGYLHNRESLLFAVPIVVLSLMNGIFSTSGYTYGNIAFMHVLFAAFILTAVSKKPLDLYSFDGMGKVVLTILGHWTTLFTIVRGLIADRKKDKGSSKIYKILIGAFIALPLLIVITSLLATADMVFHRFLTELVSNSVRGLRRIDFFFIVTFCVVTVYCTGYIWNAKNISSRRNIDFRTMPLDTTIGATFLALINALFLLFSVIQVVYLFTGGIFSLPGSIVYSEYARQGFFQLLAVTIINFAVIYVLLTFFSDAVEKPIIRKMLYMLLAFTLVLIASSFFRMFLYMNVYAATPLRLAVVTFLVAELVLIVITAMKLKDPKSPFIKRFILTLFVFYIIANVTASGYVSARVNVALFLSDSQMRWIHVNSAGPDGLVVYRPFLESDNYIFDGRHIIRRDEANVPYFFTGENTELTYEDVVHRLSRKSDAWQNWSLIEHLGRR